MIRQWDVILPLNFRNFVKILVVNKIYGAGYIELEYWTSSNEMLWFQV